MSNSSLKRTSGLSYNDIKDKYPYVAQEEQDSTYTIHSDEIGKATYNARNKSKEASIVLNQAVNSYGKGTNE